MKAKLLWAIYLVAAAAVVAVVVGYWLRRAGTYPRVPDFRLTERSGKPLTRRDLLGQVWVGDFVFLRCQSMCPAMHARMFALEGRVEGVRFVSFSVDPENDTPERMRKFVSTNGLDRENWQWATGRGREEMQTLANGFLLSGGVDEEVVHSNRFVLVDRYGRLRGAYSVVDPRTLEPDAEAERLLEEDLRRLLAEPYLPVDKLPGVNATLNGTSAVLLVLGLLFIRAKKIGAHRACMLAALASSALFLAGYLTAHYFLGSTSYPGEGWTSRPVYFAILISHTILAAFVLPLALITVFRALGGDFVRHRKIARWTLPIWLYVSVTGVVIYFMLYV